MNATSRREPLRLAIAAAALAALLHGCAPRGVSPAIPAAPRASRAVLVSIDGMGGERLSQLLAGNGKLPAGGLQRLVDTGFFAVRSVSRAGASRRSRR